MKEKEKLGRDYRHALSYTQRDFYADDELCFEASALNRSRFYNCSFNKISFKKAAVTGSIFEHCKFNNCNLDYADFEFCNFSDCEIESRKVTDCSFNNSNFIKTTIRKSEFGQCTFTNSFFEGSVLDQVNIIFSTLESACFSKCEFYNIDWHNLNLEYVEFINPIMNDVVLPSIQIPFTFGLLNYLSETNDNVKISANGKLITINDFFDIEIPKLTKKLENRKIYLPISNICLLGRNKDKDKDKGLDYLAREVTDCSFNRDYRGIKFCCKLISMCEIDRRYLNTIYKNIANIGASLEPQSTEMKNFSRNIGEIRSILFSKKESKSLFIRFKSNIGIEGSERFANLISRFQNIAKPFRNEMLNVKFSLEYNSPLYIEVEIEGDSSWFSVILGSFMIVADIPQRDFQNYPATSNLLTQYDVPLYEEALKYATETYSSLKSDGITVMLLEYRLEGCNDQLKSGGKNFYMDPSVYRVLPGSLENAST